MLILSKLTSRRTKRALIVHTIALCASQGCADRDATPCAPGVAFGKGVTCPDDVPREARVSYRLPFPAGFETTINQGYHDNPTHHEEDSYSIDFDCEPGDPITAARSGVVWRLKRDSFSGCNAPKCAKEANFVDIDHGDGTRARYHHLSPLGVTVERGEQVCRGQVIGLCGTTGYSSGPHLHWQVDALWGHSLPARFEEFRAQRGVDYAITKTSYTSTNTRESPCEETAYSVLPRDAFAHRGIVLDEPLETHFADDSPRVISGVYRGEQPVVAVHVAPQKKKTWTKFCAERDASGRFSVTLDWAMLPTYYPYYWLMITGADEECKKARWAWSYDVQVESHHDLEVTPGEPVHINRDAIDRDAPRLPD